MKIKSVLLAFLAGAMALVSCQEKEELGTPKVTVTPGDLSFAPDGGTKTVTLTATRDWVVTCPDWISVDMLKGEASTKSVDVPITVLPNSGHNRSGNVVFSIGLAKATVAVSQEGSQGEVELGDGSKENPFTIAGVIAFVEDLGADVNSPEKVYVKGKVSAISEAFSAQYGNGSFTISDDGTTAADQFTAYRVLYLGNRKWKEGDTQIKVGDDVILFGNVVNYKGNTPETQQNNAFLFSLNGKDEGGDEIGGETGEPEGSGTLEDPFNVAAAIDAVKDLTWTSNDTYDKVGPFYVKGKVGSVKEEFSAQYGNGTFTLVDEDSSAEFTAYRVLYLGNRKWKEGDTQVKEGDEVIVYAELMNYRNNTPETVSNSGYLYSLNGDTGNGEEPSSAGTPSGNGSVEDPFNVAAAIDAVKDLTWTANDNYDKVGPFYVKGKVGTVKEAFSAQYGNGTFTLVDEDSSAEFTAYRVLYLGNRKWKEGDTQVKEGDEVIVYAELMNYRNNTPETVSNSGYLYSLNGTTEGGNDNPNPPAGDVKTVTIQEFLAAAESDTQQYQLTGTIGGSINSIYGNFDLTDETGTVYVYGLTATNLGYGAKNDQSYASLGLKEGDNITIIGYRGSYNGKDEVVYAYFVKKNSGSDTPSQPSTGDNFTSTVGWDLGDKGYSQKATVNGEEDVDVLKLGTGSAPGVATLSVPEDAETLSFYALSWNGKPATMVLSKGNTQLASLQPAANTGLAGTPPYTLTVTDADHYTVSLAGTATTSYVKAFAGPAFRKSAGTMDITVTTEGDNTRVALFGIRTNLDGGSDTPDTPDTPSQPSAGEASGSGTLADPFNVAAALNATAGLTWTSNSSYDKVGPYYVKGKISRIASGGTFTEGASYGNASFYISDDGTETNEFYCFRVLYLGNQKYTSGTDIAVGDEVIVYAELMNYKGNTPETVSNSGYLYSLNGKTGDTPDTPSQPSTGEAKVATVQEFLAAAESETQQYQLTGTIGGSINNTYGNFDLTDETGTVYVYGLTATNLGYGASNDKSFASLNLKEGDNITIIGYRGSYNGKDEVVYAYFVKKNSGSDTPSQPSTGGEYDSNVTWTYGTDAAYNEKATVNGTADVAVLKLGTSSKFGTSTLTLPEGTTSLSFYALSWKNNPATILFKINGEEVAYAEPAASDAVSGTSPYTLTVTSADKYLVTFPATSTIQVMTEGSGKRAVLFAIQAGNEQGGSSARPKTVTLAEFLAADPSSSQPYQIRGTITNLTNRQYGIFDLTDGTTTVHVNGLTSSDLGFGSKNDRSFQEINIQATDDITIAGYRGTFNFVPEMQYGYIVRVNSKGSGVEPVAASGSGTLADPFNIAAAINYIDGGGTDNVYVKGKISASVYTFSASHGTGTFWISDDGTAYGVSSDKKSTTEPTKDFECYSVYWLGNQSWAEGNSQPAVGDEVVIYGKLTKYNTTYETSSKNAYVYSWNGNTTDPASGSGGGNNDPDPGTGGDSSGSSFTSIAMLNSLASDTATEYTGTLTDAIVSFVPSTTNAIIKDATGSILLYKKNHGLQQGQTFSGETTVTVQLYQGAGELTAIDATFTGAQTAVAPETATLASIAADFNKWQNAYVEVSNLEVTAVSGKNISVKDGNDTYVVFSNAGNATCSVGDVLKVKGTICQYQGTYEIKAWTASDIEVVSTGGGDNNDPDPGTGGGSTVTLDLTAQGYENQEVFTSLTVSGVTMTGDKGSNNNTPKYYKTGTAVRFYGGNTFTISSTSTITKITLTFGSGDGSNEITASPGTFATPDWTGSSNSVTFTVGGTTGHRKIAKVEVTLE